jgi:hypothetical protein
MEQDLDFDMWFDMMEDKARSLDYEGSVDKYSFQCNWEDGETPEYAAEEFVKEMTD